MAGRKLLVHMLTVATLLIAKQWKLEEVKATDWIEKLRTVALMSKLSARTRYRAGNQTALEEFRTHWHRFVTSKYNI